MRCGTEGGCRSYKQRRRYDYIPFVVHSFRGLLASALLALVLYPLIWLLLLPFRIVGIAVGGVLELVKAIIFLPARVLRGRA
jgi:hypothetical protein